MMGQGCCSYRHQRHPTHSFLLKNIVMKVLSLKKFFQKHGRKALIIYLCWCAVKGILFLLVGYKLFS